MKFQNLQNRFNITLFTCITVLMFSSSLQSQGEFITKWANFTAATTQLNFNTQTVGAVNYTWTTIPSNKSGNGTFTQNTAGALVLSGLTIATGDTLTLRIAPNNLKTFYINDGPDKLKFADVVQWGTANWSSMQSSFKGCSALIISAVDVPNLVNVTDMSEMFSGASIFNQNIGSWNTSNVTDMSEMFSGASIFNQNIGSWNTSNATDFVGMFYNASSFNQNIGNWNTSKVTIMSYMFNNASSFNQNIGNWNTSNVNNMSYMFWKATTFNQDIGNWNTSKVNNMRFMFSQARKFNQDIGNWDTKSVNNMSGMFLFTDNFNQDLGSWNVTNVTDLNNMFNSAYKFNKNLGKWILNPNVDMSGFFTEYTKLDCDNYSATLVGWSKNNTTVMGRSLGATGRQYGTSALAARNTLITTQGWTITGDTSSNSKCDLLLATETLPFNEAINIYPNPTSGLINITEMDKADYTISDISGKILSEGKVTNGTISIEKLPIGMYFLKMTNTKYTTTKKIWKE
jgi:surface protein